jgi:Gram-negative bacterial TonB protein C-terminal
MKLEDKGVPEEAIGSLSSCFVEGDPEQQQRERKLRRRAVLLSIVLQSIVVAALVLFPLLGKSERITYTHTILPPYGRPGGVPHRGAKAQPPQPGGQKRVCIVCPIWELKPTTQVTATVTTLLNEPGEPFIPGAPEGQGVPGGSLDRPTEGPEKPIVKTSEGPTKILKVTSLEPAMLTHRVEPVYPVLAKQIRHEGRVELHALIATDGSIQMLEAVGGDPLFFPSALAAVREWRYRPTYLDGQAVGIDTYITVVYRLSQQ